MTENFRTSHSNYHPAKVEIKDCGVMIDGKNCFDQWINDDTKTYEKITKIGTSKGDYYTTDYFLDYLYFKENYKIIAIDLSKQQALDDYPRAIQQINFTANLNTAEKNKILHCWRNKWNCPGLSTRNCKSFVNVL